MTPARIPEPIPVGEATELTQAAEWFAFLVAVLMHRAEAWI